jgi:hypothetical protein
VAQDTASADAILKNYYLPVVREMINQRAILLFGYTPAELAAGFGTANALKGETQDYRGISRDAEMVQFAGRQWVFTVHIGRNESGTARDEMGTLPPAGQQAWEDLSDKVRRFYKQIYVSGFAIALTERSIGSYLALLETETEGAINDLRKDLNRQAYGDQTGTLATVSADGTNTVTVDTLQYLRVGQYIDIVDSGTDAVLAANRKITAINTTTKVVTYDGADVAATTAHRICLNGNWKKEMNGLQKFVRSDLAANNTLHTINSSTAGNEWWQAKQKNGTNTTFDEDMGQQLLDEIGAEGRETEILIGTRGIRRRYLNTLKAQKRFNDSQSLMLHGGFKYIDYNGVPMLFDDDCPKKNLFFLRPGDLMWVVLGDDFDWMDRDGAILRKVESPDQDAYKATLFKYCDLGCFRRNCLGVIYNLADDVP